MKRLTLLALALAPLPAAAQVKPAALAVEAEDFTSASGWKVVKYGEGNGMVDLIGFNHTSGERLLHLGAAEKAGSASKDVTIPTPGDYRLWARYEYATNTSALFRVKVEQGGKVM